MGKSQGFLTHHQILLLLSLQAAAQPCVIPVWYLHWAELGVEAALPPLKSCCVPPLLSWGCHDLPWVQPCSIPWALPPCHFLLDTFGLSGPAHLLHPWLLQSITLAWQPFQACVPLAESSSTWGQALILCSAAGPRPWSHHSSRWHQRQLIPLLDPAPGALVPQFQSPQSNFPATLEQIFL